MMRPYSDNRRGQWGDPPMPEIKGHRSGVRAGSEARGRLWIYPIEHANIHRMKKWIVEDKKHLAGAPRIRGTRIAVSLLLESFAAGMSIREIVDAYPSLTEDAVRGALEQLAREQRKAA